MAEDKVVRDSAAQAKRIRGYIMPGETLHALFDRKGDGTGFVRITDQRVIFCDQGVLVKKKTMVSITAEPIQILTIADRLAGKGIDYPAKLGANVTYKKAPKAKDDNDTGVQPELEE